MSKRRSKLAELAKPGCRGEALKDLHARLRARYPEKEYALFHEVRNETGFASQPRYADAIVMGLWPSRGLNLEGFECKVDRGDWLRELRAPEKADAIAPYCDLWWLVTPTEGVATLDEIPAAWGWLVPHGKAFKVAKQPKTNAAPLAVDRAFLASVFRAAQSEGSIVPRLEAMRSQMAKELDERVEWAKKSAEREFAGLRDAVRKFEEASGISIDRWQGERMGAEVRAVQELRSRGQRVDAMVEHALKQLDRDRDALRTALDHLKTEQSKTPEAESIPA